MIWYIEFIYEDGLKSDIYEEMTLPKALERSRQEFFTSKIAIIAVNILDGDKLSAL